MKSALAIVALTGVLALPATAADDFQYNMNTAKLPDGSLVVANVVRGPKFTGEKDEKVQAMDQAKVQLDSDYCSQSGTEFVVDNGLVLFDEGLSEWMVGGVCR